MSPDYDKRHERAKVYILSDYVTMENKNVISGTHKKLILCYKDHYVIEKSLGNDRCIVKDTKFQVTQKSFNAVIIDDGSIINSKSFI